MTIHTWPWQKIWYTPMNCVYRVCHCHTPGENMERAPGCIWNWFNKCRIDTTWVDDKMFVSFGSLNGTWKYAGSSWQVQGLIGWNWRWLTISSFTFIWAYVTAASGMPLVGYHTRFLNLDCALTPDCAVIQAYLEESTARRSRRMITMLMCVGKGVSCAFMLQ